MARSSRSLTPWELAALRLERSARLDPLRDRARQQKDGQKAQQMGGQNKGDITLSSEGDDHHRIDAARVGRQMGRQRIHIDSPT